MMRFQTGAFSTSQFRWFFAGRATSMFGSAMTPIALAFAVLQTPNGEQLLGYVLAAEIVPHLLMVLIGGSVADRYRRDILILISNVGSGLSQTGIAVLVLTHSDPYLIFPFAALNGVLVAFTSPAMRGIIPEIVDSQNINQANSLLATARSSAKIVGPTAAGVLVATVGGGWGILFDAVSFFAAAVCLTRVKIPSHPAASETSLVEEMREGWSYFSRHQFIWLITAAFAVMNAIQMGVWQVLGPIIAKQSFGASGWGLTISLKSVGLFAASVVMLRVQLRRPLRDGMIAVALSGIPMVVLGGGYPLPYLIAAAAVAGAGSTISTITWDTSLQLTVPRDMLSRVCAFDDFGSYMAIPIGEILAVPIAKTFGYHTVAMVGGIIFTIVALVPLFNRLVRQMSPN
jgi:MFS family permease